MDICELGLTSLKARLPDQRVWTQLEGCDEVAEVVAGLTRGERGLMMMMILVLHGLHGCICGAFIFLRRSVWAAVVSTARKHLGVNCPVRLVALLASAYPYRKYLLYPNPITAECHIIPTRWDQIPHNRA